MAVRVAKKNHSFMNVVHEEIFTQIVWTEIYPSMMSHKKPKRSILKSIRSFPYSVREIPPTTEIIATGTIAKVHFIMWSVSNQVMPEYIRFGSPKETNIRK